MEYQAVIDQLTERINVEVENQLGVYLASFRVNATTFYNDMIGALRAANRVCNDRGNGCLSDLGAFLSGELIREEQQDENAETVADESEGDAESAEEGDAESVEEEAAPADEGEGDTESAEEEAAPVEEEAESADEGEGDTESAEEEAAPVDEGEGDAAPAEEGEGDTAPVEEEAAPAEEEAAPAQEEAAPAQEEAAPAPATPVSAVAAAFRGSKRISKALFNEALRAYKANRFRSKRHQNPRKNNMVQVPIF